MQPEHIVSKNARKRQKDETNPQSNLEFQGLQIVESETIPQNSKQCRICLQQARIQDQPLLSPCACIGTLRYVHNPCYKKWIQHTMSLKPIRQKKQILKNGFKCQICKHIIDLSLGSRWRCRNCRELKIAVQNREIIFGLGIIFLIFNLGGIAFLLYIVSRNGLSFNESILSGVFKLIALLFLFSLCLCTLYHLLKEFFLIQQLTFLGITKTRPSINILSSEIRSAPC